jgi:hypothetical protein
MENVNMKTVHAKETDEPVKTRGALSTKTIMI